ncbi:MAG: hydantoinase/oxoprolinase family protein [Burkholderiaceae bacterium]|nr:hydantoinase/oxoprolinase family protein [Burkholderiaceae bacterium]
MTMASRLGIDTGGTHTDLVYVDESGKTFLTLKVATTPGDLSEGILAGTETILAMAGVPPASLGRFIYGTTLVTNLIVQGSELPIGLITTHGFRDVLAIGRASRKLNIYDIYWHPAQPLVPRHLRLTVPERSDYQGAIVTPLDEDAARLALRELAAAGVQSIAVCFLHAYANPRHEQRVRELAAEECPQVDISLSSEVANEFREYERMSTTAVNAYVSRSITHHLDRLAGALESSGVPATPAIMRSNGGLMTFSMAKRLPVAITHSGPMGGIIGGIAIAAACGIRDLITLDMGGTSADVSLVADGSPVATTRGKLGHYPVLLPMLDLVTIGAGGGSIARVDEGKALRVGPTSAGSVPGPACYGQGGKDATMTDANLVAGRLNGEYFLAGARALRRDLAEAALRDNVAQPLGMSLAAAAIGVLTIAESHMVNAIKLISVQRGLDPRDFTLVAFGGAGPLHAVRLAEELGITRVLIPPAPGNASAMGLLAADIRHDLVRTYFADLAQTDLEALAATLREMLEEGASVLEAEGSQPALRRFLPAVDLRYQGQNYELTLPLSSDAAQGLAVADLEKRFHERHRQVYGYDLKERVIQVVNLRLTAIGGVEPVHWPRHDDAAGTAVPTGTRPVQLDRNRCEQVSIYRVETLGGGHSLVGPAIVEYPGSTLFLPDGWTATIDSMRNAHLNQDSGRNRS